MRSGGHGLSGRSTNDGGIIISLSQMNSIEVIDKATRRIRVGPGARWMTVAEKLEPYGWALSSGDYGGVGSVAWRQRAASACSSVSRD